MNATMTATALTPDLLLSALEVSVWGRILIDLTRLAYCSDDAGHAIDRNVVRCHFFEHHRKWPARISATGSVFPRNPIVGQSPNSNGAWIEVPSFDAVAPAIRQPYTRETSHFLRETMQEVHRRPHCYVLETMTLTFMREHVART